MIYCKITKILQLFITMKTIVLAVVACLVMTGCASVFQLDENARAPSNDESVVILGVSNEHYHVLIFPGSIDKDGTFSQSLIRPATVAGKPRNGYLVGRASADDVIAITAVVYHDNPDTAFFGSKFTPCADAKTMTFKVPHGKIVYLGDVDYQFVGRQLRVNYYDDLEKAQKYIDSSFPALKGRVEHIAPNFNPTGKACDSFNYMPIYIPRR
jgi:hypothetical protein